jgi:hypothetical protein
VTDARYAALAALADRERAAAHAGRLDEVEALAAERAALVAALPAQAPAGARDALEAALAAQDATRAALAEALAGVRGELTALGRGRQAARAYGASLKSPA